MNRFETTNQVNEAEIQAPCTGVYDFCLNRVLAIFYGDSHEKNAKEFCAAMNFRERCGHQAIAAEKRS